MSLVWVSGAVLALLFAIPVYAQVGLNVDAEARVRDYFSASPIMIDIARCESKFRQYTDAGNPLYGGVDGRMVGVYQIYSDVHMNDARSRGFDIETLEGNLAYAKLLFDREGTQPWLSSMPCWGKEINNDIAAASVDSLTLNLSMGMEHPQVLLLQKMLNAKGFAVATEGPGSIGNETQKFGAFTRAAVKKFQCEKMQICDGDEHSNGYGFVGARTRAALSGESVAPITPPAAVQTPDQQAQIVALQAQIAELTKVLAELLAKKAQ